MYDYLLLFRGGDSIKELSPEEKQAHMSKWGTWMSELDSKGQFLSGDPLEVSGDLLRRKGKEIVTDGPYPESKELVGGYLIIRAENQSHAVEISKGCPIFETDGTVEVRQITPLKG